jgi:hypothetical protein
VTSSIGHMGTASSAANDSLSDDSVHKMLHRPAYLRFTRKFTSKNCCVNSRGRIQRIPMALCGLICRRHLVSSTCSIQRITNSAANVSAVADAEVLIAEVVELLVERWRARCRELNGYLRATFGVPTPKSIRNAPAPFADGRRHGPSGEHGA